jgi:hypothetical protein
MIFFVIQTIKLECFVPAKPIQPSITVSSRGGAMDKLQLSGQNLGRVFNSRGGHVYAMHSSVYYSKLPNFKLKTWPKQLLGSVLLDIELPGGAYH